MNDTPFFGPWIHRLAPMGSRTAQAVERVRAYTLCQLENCFAPWLPEELFPKASAQANSRDRHYTRWRTFWCSLWQNLNPEASCREVVRQLQALFRLEGGPQISEEDGAYCRAKARLPLAQFPKALAVTARFADQLATAELLKRSSGQGRGRFSAHALSRHQEKSSRLSSPPVPARPTEFSHDALGRVL